MARRKATKEQTKIYQDKRMSKMNPQKIWGWTQVPRKGSSSCSTSGNRCVTLVKNAVVSHEQKFVTFSSE